jgi:hypothetical protein
MYDAKLVFGDRLNSRKFAIRGNSTYPTSKEHITGGYATPKLDDEGPLLLSYAWDTNLSSIILFWKNSPHPDPTAEDGVNSSFQSI